MKKLGIYFISFVLIFNPTVLYAKSTSIKDKTKFYQIINCSNLFDDFNEFSNCVDQQSLTSQNLGNLKNKKKREIFDILAIVNIINESVNEGFVEDQEAFKNWNTFLNSNYKKKSSKKKLKEILDATNCKNIKDYEQFVNCFNNEFRTYDIYQYANIKTKERMEHIVFNSLILTKPDGLVYTLKKENLYGVQDFDKLYTEGDGYDFFFTLMNALGTDYFKKVKHKSDVDWNKIIKFIVIAIIVAVVAKGLLKTFSKSSFSSSSASSASGTSSTGGLTYNQSISPANVGGQSMGFKNMFRYAPPNSVFHTGWFKYGFVKGFW